VTLFDERVPGESEDHGTTLLLDDYAVRARWPLVLPGQRGQL
jgi:hypothetical protein